MALSEGTNTKVKALLLDRFANKFLDDFEAHVANQQGGGKSNSQSSGTSSRQKADKTASNDEVSKVIKQEFEKRSRHLKHSAGYSARVNDSSWDPGAAYELCQYEPKVHCQEGHVGLGLLVSM